MSTAESQQFVVTVHYNDDALFVRGWKPLDRIAYTYTIAVDAPTPEFAAEEAFRLLNRDDRPNRYHQRSMSVGDVAVVRLMQSGDAERRAFSCQSVGFEEVTNIWKRTSTAD